MKGRLLESLGVVIVLATDRSHERVGPSELGGYLARRLRHTL